MIIITNDIFIPLRSTWIQPHVVQHFSNGVDLIEYYWCGAEYAHIGEFCIITTEHLEADHDSRR